MTEETVTIPRKKYEELMELEKEVQKLSQANKNLWEQVHLFQRHVFGKSSEITKAGNEEIFQPSLIFNEAEACSDEEIKKEVVGETQVKSHTRKKYVTKLDNLPDDIEVEIIENELPESERICKRCGEKLEEAGVDIQRRLKIIPAKVSIVEIRTHSYKCTSCAPKESEEGKTYIVRAEEEPAVIPGGPATAEAIAYLMTEKYVMYSPLYRIEQQMNAAGIPLSRQTMSNWLIAATNRYLEPLWNRMREKLVEEEVLHADETTLQVLKEPGRGAETKSYMWLYRTGKHAKQPLILYDYQETRASEHPRAFLKDFRGYLHTDGYAGYHKLPMDIHIVGCLAHARRKFYDAFESVPAEKRSTTTAARAVGYFDKLFRLEEEFIAQNLTPEEIYSRRQIQSRPQLEEMKEWISKINAAPKSLLGNAIQYFKDQWQWLTVYLEDGRLDISNNLAERSIKPFVMGRKNFLFANTPSGAHSSAVIYSIIETAKESGLDSFSYLTWLFKKGASLRYNLQTNIDSLLPANAPAECRTKSLKK